MVNAFPGSSSNLEGGDDPAHQHQRRHRRWFAPGELRLGTRLTIEELSARAFFRQLLAPPWTGRLRELSQRSRVGGEGSHNLAAAHEANLWIGGTMVPLGGADGRLPPAVD